jgi:hypothetical protein
MLLQYHPTQTKKITTGTRTIIPMMTSTTVSKPDAKRTGNKVKHIIRTKNRMKFADSQVTKAGAGLNSWVKEK